MPTDSSTTETRQAATTAPIAAADHAHHWLIEAAAGAESVGRCKICGIENTFSNTTQGVMWERNSVHEPAVATLRRDRARAREEFTLSDEAA